jgi:uncharacterized MAPEG superfamily protein
MNPELTTLAWAVALAFVQVLIAVQGAMMQVGLMTLVGNREHFPELTGWAGRAHRAQRNMIENLVLFAALVLAAVAAGRTDNITLVGAELFLWARVAYAIVYLIGLQWLRTGVWAVSIVGLIMIFSQLL